jgi:hypothetical protein
MAQTGTMACLFAASEGSVLPFVGLDHAGGQSKNIEKELWMNP